MPWYARAYRRNIVDMHISDDDPRFMTRFDPKIYVEHLLRAQVQSAVVYAHSHAGLCFYPSAVGPQHRGLAGRDIVGEITELCQQQGIQVVLYQSLIHDTWAYRHQADWRMMDAHGQPVAERSRYGLCCPNSPYRDYAAAMAREIATRYPAQGMRFDMTFWPRVCYCPHCRARYRLEEGDALPTTVDWDDPAWVGFQRRREAWLVDFAASITTAAQAANPDLTIEHQASTYPLGWRLGVTAAMAEQNTFLQGDFYGDALQGSFARKLFHNLSRSQPPAFETSVGVDLRDYTALKPIELLRAKAFAALADGCAFAFIDSIDPTGTMNPIVYERMGAVFEETRPYEAYVGGHLVQDVGVYLSTLSKHDPADNGKSVEDPGLSPRMPHVEAALSACRALREAHVPFGVLTEASLASLSRHKTVVLPNVVMLSLQEAQALREFVRRGGNLYASGPSSLVTPDGRRQPDLLLGDVLGVTYQGQTSESFTYIYPEAGQEALFAPYTRQHPPGLMGHQVVVEATTAARVLGRLALPYTHPGDPSRFASIHNNPPGDYTSRPALVMHRFGAGQAIYVAGCLEGVPSHEAIFLRLLRAVTAPYSFQADAPRAVEITLFEQPERQRLLISLVNFQAQLPNIPVEGIRLRLHLGQRQPARLLLLPEEKDWPFALDEGGIRFEAPRLETFAMLALDLAARNG